MSETKLFLGVPKSSSVKFVGANFRANFSGDESRWDRSLEQVRQNQIDATTCRDFFARKIGASHLSSPPLWNADSMPV